MGSQLINLVKKEIKEIFRDPRLTIGMILVPLIIFPILGTVMSGMSSGVQEAQYAPIDVAIINLDEGNLSRVILRDPSFRTSMDYLNVTLLIFENVNESEINLLLESIYNNDSIAGAILIPRNFTYSISNQIPARIKAYIPYHGMSFIEPAEGRILAVVDVFNRYVSAYVISNLDPNANVAFVEDPIDEDIGTIYEGEVIENLPPSVISGLVMSKVVMLPIALMMILILAIQFAAITVASEKEQKTLETLLTLPIDRTKIVLGKLTGSLIVSTFGTIGFGLGFQYYMSQVTSSFGGNQSFNVDLEKIGLTMTTIDYALLISSVFLSLFSILSITMILAAFAEDVRTAQSMIGVLIAPITILPIVGIFSVISGQFNETIGLILLIIPFSSPMIAPLYIFQKKTMLVLIANIAIAIQTIIYFKIATWFFSSERVLTAKLRFKTKKSK